MKNFTRAFRTAIIFIAFSTTTFFSATAQVVSTNGGSGLAATYPSLASAISALNLATITAPVVITLNQAETAPASGYVITKSGTAVNTITIQGVNTATAVVTASTQTAGGNGDAVFKIVGADYITLQNFTIQENGGNTVTATGATNTMTEFGVALFLTTATDGAQNNTIQNNIISLNASYPNSVGVFSSSSNSSVIGTLEATATTGTNSNNKVYGNTISNVAYGVFFICPPVTSTINEAGNDIGGSSAGTANTITFGCATVTSGPWNRSPSSVHAGVLYRNGAGVSVRFNSITSTSLAYGGSAGVFGVSISNGTVPTTTYTANLSNNTINLTNTGVNPITGVDFGYGLAGTTLTGGSNNITINQNSSLASTSGAITGVKASYTAGTSSFNTNTIVINQTYTPTATNTNSSSLLGIGMPNGTTGTPTMTATGNTITINRSSSPTAGTSTMSGAVAGIAATTAASTVTIGATGVGNNNTITIKEAQGGAGTTSYTSAVTYVDLSTVAHGTANVVNNTFNTTGSTILSTGQLSGVFCNGTPTALYFIKGNTSNIDRVATTGAVYFTYQTTTPSNPADTVSENNITFTNLATSGSITAISQIGGPTTPGANNKKIGGNTINISGTATGTVIGINYGYINGSIYSNSITISTASPTVSGLVSSTTASAVSITGNTISLTSSTTSPTAMTGISAANTGPYTITGNNITALNFSGIISAAPTVAGISLSVGSTNTVSGNTISSITVGANSSTASPTVDGISITGGTTNNISGNTISNISTGTSSGNATIRGLNITAGTTNNVFKNKIADLSTSNSGTSSVVYGLSLSAGTTNTVYYNLIGNLTAPFVSSTDVIRGISSTASGTSAMNIYYNTVYINATPDVTVTNYGTAGLHHVYNATGTFGALDLRNNIIVNKSTAKGTGFTAAFRRTANTTTYANFVSTSNNNLYYAGVPGASNLIFMDFGSGNTSSLATYKALTGLSPRDAASISLNPTFLSTTGSSSNFLHLDPASANNNTINQGAGAIATYVSDYDGDTRCATGCSGATLPDIGADEFTYAPAATDMAVTNLVSPTSSTCHSATESVTVAIQNNGGNVVNFATNNVTVTAVGSGAAAGYNSSFTITSGSLVSAGIQNVTMPATLNTLTAGTYTITYTVSIAGATDANSGNNSAVSSAVSSGGLSVSIAGAGGICPLGANVTLTATASGGQSAYTWSAGWTTPGTTSTRSVAAGTYNVTVTDACAATASAASNFVVASYGAPTASITTSTTPAAVCGTTPVTLTAGAGAGYSYKWSVTGASTTYTGLTQTSGGAAYAGTNLSPVYAAPAATTAYTLTVTDANTCTATAAVTATVYGATTVSATATPSTVCSGGSTQLQATAAQVSTALPNSYGFVASSGSFTPLSGANTIAGGNADTYISGALPIGFTFPYNGTTYTNFYFSSNGFISFTNTVGSGTTNALATAASPVLAPLWDDLDGASAGAASYLTTGTAGSRVLTVQWLNWEWQYTTNAATISFQVKIYEADGHIEFIYRQDATAVATPSASIGISGASGNYLSLNNSGTSPTKSSSSETTTIATKPATGQVYTFTPPAISFTYQWAADPSFTTATNIANPQATPTGNTTYTVTATATGGCTATASQSVTVAPLSVSIAGLPTTLCLGASSTLTATATGGCTPYATFVWSTGANTGTTNTLSVTPGSSGTIAYSVTVTDNGGNTASATTNITVNPSPAVTITTAPTNSAICGTGNVVMTANGSGGSGSLTYAWSPTTNLQPVAGNVSVETATPTSSKAYNVTVTDANVCTATATKTVGVYGTTTVTASATPTSVCPGGSTQLQATGAQVTNLTANGYGFSASSSSFTPLSSATPIVGGNADTYISGALPIGFTFNYNGTTYTQFYFSSNGFISFTSTVGSGTTNALATAASPVLAPLWDDLDGASAGTASYKTTGTAGSQVLTVEWLNWEWQYNTNAATISFQVKIYEADGHIEFIYRQDATAVSGPSASIGISGASGNYLSLNNSGTSPTPSSSSETTTIATKPATGQMYTFTKPAIPTFTYQWAADASFTTATNISNPQASPTLTTVYTVTTTAAGGCTATVTQSVTVAPLSVTVAGSPAAFCLGASSTLTATATGGCTPYATYVWSTGANTAAVNTLAVTPGSSGSVPYSVTVTDNTGNTASATVSLTVNPVPAVTVSTVPTLSAVCGTGSVVMTANGSGGTGSLTYAWSPTTNLLPVAGNVSVETATPTVSRTYNVTVTDANVCTATANKTVSVYGTTTVTASATPSTLCPGGSTQLQATGSQVYNNTANAYSFAGSTGSYAAITGTTLGAGAIGDDVGIGNLPIGFTFNYNGTPFTVFGARSNGLIELGQTTVTLTGFSANSLSTTPNIIAPLWEDNNTTGGSIIYSTTGSVGSRILTVQYTGMHVGNSGGSSQPTIDLQVLLYEGTGVIQFKYGSTSAAFTSTTASIGISGAAGNYISVTPLSPANTSTISTSSENTGISAATNFPTGTIYTFTPPTAPAFTYQWAADASFTTATNISNPQASPALTTVYTVTASATGGCTATVTQSVTVSPLAVSVAGAPATVCLGRSSTLTATATGGCLPYATFVWSTGANTGTTNTLAVTPGSTGSIPYNVTVTDNSGNTASATVNLTVTAPPSLSVTTVPTNSTICGTGNVVMTANGTGGTGSLTYAWSPTTNLLPVLGTSSIESASPTVSRTYNVTVTDANTCTATSTKTVSVYGATTVSATATPTVLCPGSTAQLQATGAQVFNQTPNAYGFSASSSSFTPLSGGTAITGGNADSYFSGALPIGFTFSYNGTTYTNFYFSSNGFISLTNTIGTATTNALATASSPVLAPLWDDLDGASVGTASYKTTGTAGSQVLTVEWLNWEWQYNTNAATISFQVKIYEADGHIEFIYRQDATALSSPSASIGISGAAGKYLSLNNSGTLPTASSSSETTTIATKPATGQMYTFTKPTAPSFTYQWAADASFITATNISNPQATPSLTTVYTVTATEALGCTATASATVSIIPLSVSVAGAPASVCLGRASTLTATSTGGCTPYATYVWSTGANTGTTNTLSVTPGSTGSVPYSVTVTDAIGNTASATLNLTVNPTPAVTIGTVPASSAICGTGNVVMTANGSGGTGSLTYAWSPTTNLQPVAGNVSIETATPTSSKTYNVTVTDANTCTATANQTVSVFGVTMATATATPASTCSGGSVQLQATATQAGGQTANLYSFATSTGAALDPMTAATTLFANSTEDDVVAVTPSPTFAFNFEGTSYSTFTVSNDGWLKFGSSTTQQYINSVTSATNVPKVYPFWDDLNTGSTGNVKYVVTGTAPNRIMKVQWFTNVPYSTSANANSTFQLWLYETTNVVEFRYGTLGTPTSASISAGITGATSTNYKSITYSSNTASSVAANDANATKPASGRAYSFTPPAPTTTFTYQWAASPTFTTATNIDNPQATLTGTTTYTVTATEALGCTASASVSVAVASVSVTSITSSPVVVCQNSTTTLTANATGGCLPYSNFHWNDGANTATNTHPVTPTSSGATTYSVTVTDAFGTTASVSASIFVISAPSVTIGAAPSAASYCGAGNVVLTATATGGNGTYAYSWSPNANLTPSSGAASVETASPSATTAYVVTVTDGNTCTATATRTVTVYPAVSVNVSPTAVSTCSAVGATLTATAGYGQTVSNATGITIPTSGNSTPYPSTITLSGLPTSGVTIKSISINGYSHLFAADVDVLLQSPTGQTLAVMSDAGSISSPSNVNYTFQDGAAAMSTSGANASGTYAPFNNGVGTSDDNWTAPGPGSSYTPTLTTLAGFTGNLNGTWNLYVTDDSGLDGGSITSWSITYIAPATGITYNWSPATGLTPTTGTVVSAAPASTNTYAVTATDANSCTATASSVVTINNTALSVTTSASPTTDCVGKNTTLTATAVGGCIPFTYNWSNSLGTATTATTAIAAPGANVYSVTVTDAAGNTVSSSVTVTGKALPAITFTANPAISAICGSGNVVLTAGPAAQTSYAWSPAGGLSSTNTATTTATPSLTTPYTVTVTGTNGCTASATQTVGVYGPVTASASVTTSPICYGTNTQLNSSGTQSGSPASTSAAGYTFLTAATGALDAMTGSTTLISNSVDDTPTSVQTFPAGFTFNFEGTNYTQYSVSPDGWLKLGSGAATAQYTNVVTSTTNVPKLYPLWDDHATGTDGSVKVLITGTAPNRIFKVQWKINTLSNSSFTNATFQLWMYETSNKVEFRYGTIGTVYGASVGITGLTSTNYNSVTISTNTTSNSSSNNANTVAPSNPRTYTFTPPVPFSTTYSYNWSNASSYLSATNISNPFANNVTAAENYTVTVTAANGCANTATVTVNINPLPTFTTVVTNVACLGANNGQIDVTPVVGTPTFTYSNNNGSTYQAGSNFSGLSPITYQVRVKDGNGCISNAQAVSLTEPTALTATASNGSPYSTTVTASLFSNGAGGTAPYTYAWSGPGFTSTLRNPTRPFTLVTMTGTYTVTVTDAHGCTATASTVMNVYDGYVWTGTVSSDWANNGNWSFQVPDYPDDCTQRSYIQAGTPFSPTVNIAGLTVGNITLVNGAVLTLANDLTLCGNLTGSATALYSGVAGPGKLIMKSTPSVQQTISGKTRFVGGLQIDNTAGVRINFGNTQVVNALELKTGVLTVSNSAYMTFISTSSSQCAVIDNFSAGMTGSISGAVVMQRKYDAPTAPFYRTQHYMGSPVDQPLFTQFGANGTPGYIINTTCNERASSPGSPFGDVAQYDEDHGAACTLQGWKIMNAGSAVNGRGYSVSKNGAGTLSLTGVPNQATSYVRTGLTNSNWTNTTLQGYTDVSGWHMMSNPWLANLRITTNGGAGIDNQVAVWQTTGGFAGTYAYYQVGFDNVDIAPFQAFFVHKTSPGGTATYTINGSDRVRTPATMQFQSLTNDHELSVYVDNNANGLRDKTIVAFNASATDGFDPIYDGNKLGGDPDRLSLYSVNNSLPMARNTLTSISNTSTVDMNFDAGTSGAFTMSFDGLNSFDPTSYIMLEDKKTNTMYNVRNGNYTFTGDTADSKNRFVLHFTPAAEITQTDATCSTTGTISVTQPGTANWNYTVTDNSNITVANGILNQTTPIAVNANPGVYTITLVDNNNYTVAKQVQVTGMQQVVASFNTTATTVQQDDDVTFTATSTNATNHVWNFGDNSSATGNVITHSYTTPGVYTAKLTSDNNDCQSISTQQITVTAKTTTGISTITDKKGITIWSSENTVYVDMSRESKVEAQIEIYNVLGQQLSIEKFGRSSIYSKQFTNLEAAYVIVRVKNNEEITTKKVFVGNSK